MISQIILISQQGSRAYVVEEHTADDGRVVRVEGLRENGDFEQQMLDRVPQIEQQLADELIANKLVEDSAKAQEKIDAYLEKVDLKKDAGLTDDEVLTLEK